MVTMGDDLQPGCCHNCKQQVGTSKSGIMNTILILISSKGTRRTWANGVSLTGTPQEPPHILLEASATFYRSHTTSSLPSLIGVEGHRIRDNPSLWNTILVLVIPPLPLLVTCVRLDDVQDNKNALFHCTHPQMVSFRRKYAFLFPQAGSLDVYAFLRHQQTHLFLTVWAHFARTYFGSWRKLDNLTPPW